MATTVAGERLSGDGKPGMRPKNHSPVGLCRMKNRKGLSTINQGGDDLAIRIAATERSRGVSQSAVGQWLHSQMLVSEDTLALSPDLACYNDLNGSHLLNTELGFSQLLSPLFCKSPIFTTNILSPHRPMKTEWHKTHYCSQDGDRRQMGIQWLFAVIISYFYPCHLPC